MASVGADNTLKMWTLAAAPGGKDDDKPVTIALAAPASAVAMTADGKRVAAAVTDARATTVRVFDAASGKEVLALGDHTRRCDPWRFLRTIALSYRRRPTRR